jgi:glucose-6-phosphate isomerase
MNTTPPTDCSAWQKLAAHAESWRSTRLAELLEGEPGRAERFAAEAPGVRLEFARQKLGAVTLRLLEQLAEERGLAEWREALFAGKPINSTEQRAAWHTALRAGDSAPAEVRETLARMAELSGRLRARAWQGATGNPIRRIVHLGTGGSDLGPRLLVDALAEECDAPLEFRFAANIDPVDLERALAGADPAATLFVLVSKTFTTQETMENAKAARRWLAAALPGAPLERHFIGVTGNARAARAFGVAETLPIPDWVGGRFSVWSAAGFTAMCAFGAERFEAFLAGGRDIDWHFLRTPTQQNVPALMALIGVWNVNFLGARTQAVLPYATALARVPAYLQQLEMESNGKRTDREGRPVDYATAPVVWGAEGTVGQHSFHQLLHQGTQVVPADFIVVRDGPGEPERRAMLAAHAQAQALALAQGRDSAELAPHRRYPGDRPSSTLSLERVDARNLGRLVALYEHKVFVQGILWNINSFDQWGVELGKEMANRILSKR